MVICFQHTYEGLKPHFHGHWVGPIYSFQHTYEGLKLFLNTIRAKGFINRFQHTYEGLKHEEVNELEEAILRVFSIPMRD